MSLDKIRNIAIIAHVDHGKTTLVDGFLRQTGIFRANEEMINCVMDSNDLEKERGITIIAKNTAITHKDHLINIVDTPGHADFGGEVERVLNMVDSALLIVDAFEGPMPQTRFVLRKALQQNLNPIVVVNKIDRPNIDPNRAVDKVFDLFVELGATNTQLNFPYIFCSGLKGYATFKPDEVTDSLEPLLDLILKHCPQPSGNRHEPFCMQVNILDYNDYLGRIAIGRVFNGEINTGSSVILHAENNQKIRGKISKLFTFHGLKRIEAQTASSGEIIALAGFPQCQVGDCITLTEEAVILDRIKVEEPTVKMSFLVNNSPLAGTEGKYVTSRNLKDRLYKELETNVSLKVEDTKDTDTFMVSGRGELHLSILIETMRREGFEFQVSRPEVIFKEVDGVNLEPCERLLIDVPDEYLGAVMQELGLRKACIQNMESTGKQTLLNALIPTRGLIGFANRYIRITRGNGVMNHAFEAFKPYSGELNFKRNGALIAYEAGIATNYALEQTQDRGVFFINPGTKVYAGMIIGENSRIHDLEINICKTKKLTNIRSSTQEVLVHLPTPQEMTLEDCLEYLAVDELLEVTPINIRMRKIK